MVFRASLRAARNFLPLLHCSLTLSLGQAARALHTTPTRPAPAFCVLVHLLHSTTSLSQPSEFYFCVAHFPCASRNLACTEIARGIVHSSADHQN